LLSLLSSKAKVSTETNTPQGKVHSLLRQLVCICVQNAEEREIMGDEREIDNSGPVSALPLTLQ
jgi:hypothetical protein